MSVTDKLDDLRRELQRYDANGMKWPAALQLIAAVEALRAELIRDYMVGAHKTEQQARRVAIIDKIITAAAPMLGD